MIRLSTLVPHAMLVLLLALSVQGCAAIGGIFKAGMWVGILVAVVVIGLIVAVSSRFR